ncbi:MAG TPA: MFS transporter [Vicinamibacterales bacterium]|nr:MFS transporter [Vicinamibacterales bacterium]
MPTSPRGLTPLQWLICAIAALGFAFDIYEILMAPLVVGPAIGELTGFKPGTPDFNFWVGMFFWVPALFGGAFGLVGGYLTDRFGRRRVLVWSILLYAFSAMAAGFATNIYVLLFLRSTTYIGVFVEFVAAVAWIAEIFPDARQREKALGYTQAFSSIGGLLVTGAYYIAVTYGASLPAIAGGHAPWRYTLISGVIPALPLIIIRPFLPESPAWQQKKAAGTLRRPSIAALFTPELRRTTMVTTLMFAFAYGAAFGAIQQMPRIVPGIEEVRTLPQPQIQQTASSTQAYQEFGGLAGRFLLAVLALYVVSRRTLIRLFQVPGLVAMPFVFYYAPTHSLTLTQWGMFVAGVFTVGQLSFWGNYLPRVYPTHLRGTGEGFAANIGGRMLGTGFAFVTTTLTNYAPGATPPLRLAFAAAVVGTFVYVAGLVCSFFLPEPKGEELPE